MSLVALDITGENKDLIAKLLQLEKKTEQLEDKLAKVGRTGKTAGEGAASAFSKMAKEAGGVVIALAGVGSVEAVINKIVDRFRRGIEEMRRISEGAAGAQATFADAFGKFLQNNPSITGDDAARWKKFAEEQGATGVRGGAAGVMAALSDLRGSTAGSSEADQLAAMAEAVKRKRLNPDTDLAKMAQAILKIRDDLGVDMQQANNVLAIYGERAGGDIAGLAGQVGKLKGLSGLGMGDIRNALSLHAFLTTETADMTGEQSSTIVANLLARAGTRDVTLGGKQVKLQGATAMDRLLETIDRINSGEFGDKSKALTEYTRELGRESASAIIALGSLRVAGGRFAETRQLINAAVSGDTDLTQRSLDIKASLLPSEGGRRRIAAARGAKEDAELNNYGGAAVADAETELKTWGESLGILEVTDPTRGARRAYAERYTPTATYLAEEKRLRVRNALMKRMPYVSTGVGPAVPLAPQGETPEEMMAFGATHGAIDSATRLDLFEQQMLRAAGASPEQISELQGLFEKGLKDAFKAALSELVGELRQTKGQTRQELD